MTRENEQTLARDREDILRFRNQARTYFWLSVPGFVALTARISWSAMTGFSDIKSAQEEAALLNYSTYIAPFVLWWVPFEIAERRVSKMKSVLRGYLQRSGSEMSPVKYGKVIRLVNTVMKIAHDRSSLPPEG